MTGFAHWRGFALLAWPNSAYGFDCLSRTIQTLALGLLKNAPFYFSEFYLSLLADL